MKTKNSLSYDLRLSVADCEIKTGSFNQMICDREIHKTIQACGKTDRNVTDV